MVLDRNLEIEVFLTQFVPLTEGLFIKFDPVIIEFV